MKTLKNIIFVTLPSLLVVLLLLEVIFRTIIPASDPPRDFFDEKEKIFSYDNNKKEGLNTIGKFAEIRAKWRLNNMNWNYPIDYYPNKDTNLIAVIGDSFIEALQVNVGENYPFLLREKLKNDYEVYAFGKSGAPLSQYLYISRYVNKYFNSKILIFNIVHNDFDESIQELYPNFFYFFQISINNNDSIKEIIAKDFSGIRFKPLKKLIYKSALFRYIYLNLKVRQIRSGENKFQANINVDSVEKNKDLIFKSTNYLVKKIRTENSNKRVIFIMDAARDVIYENAIEKSNVLWMNKMLDTICSNNKIEFIDLTPFMKEDYKNNHIKFNSDIDGHWNEYGHKFVANVLYNYLKNNKQ